MCNVCGCGDSQIEGHSHEHHSHEDKHEHPHQHNDHSAIDMPQSIVIHHHYHHQGDVHHHVHYTLPAGTMPEQATDGHDYEHVPHSHDHSHHHADNHQHEQHQPERLETGDLHYGKGEAEVHVAGVSQRQLLTLEMDILGNNNQLAVHNREHFIENRQLVLNLVSSPGSGKTTLLTETLMTLKDQCVCAVIEGDQQTSNDADRIRATTVPAIQVNTGKGCHLDAQMIHDAYHQLAINEPGFLFIENVGNLVCPASFDLGEAAKVAILSVTEGEDKPLKYPNMFAAADLMIINKIDLLPYVDVNIEDCIANARKVNPTIQVIKLSAKTGEGMDAWFNWLNENRQQL
ncbi:hydrogenase nickel incorporation protein HypB [Photobacterium carnosum]|uniref:hydrogenase nickel incorporation protein HypB n=1 Tax=Photobacterium carnosum TaxID=2023717 RepID=UPI001C92320F|nr:hydrogenase nickel incorporation protein HypB [Photobacterium carnosum]MBY3787792.1 hydrogenase nickel incorporation protein HypB [Photobacterium carnosum]MCD9514806.1 hydrogenase nickel incorporation protein HypB [Photobacterium carnosum]MCD9532422.1 hydrogenase nickel incorporation protein HypB [Photobacterium carnosum]MCD9543545.1 hydrogenase nickel incorporation protein HypB [Photobacterium carnosum]